MSTATTTDTSRPAILGGKPIFEHKVPIVRPVLPAFGQLQSSLAEILSTGMVTKGTNLRAFEEAVAQHLGVKHAVAVSSCTSGLMLSYQGLRLKGDVVVPSFTFMATISALVWAGIRPIFADVDPTTNNLDPAAAEAAITPETTAIVAVHNFGNPADIAELQAVADRHGLKLIFDAAHGLGSLYQGQPVGRQGDAQVYSLSPTKLVIAGEGGIIATEHDHLAEWARRGREYGMGEAYDSIFAGLNSRMSEFNALLGRSSLPLLDSAVKRRQELAALYRQELAEAPGIGFQQIRRGNRSSYKDLSVTIDAAGFGVSRDELSKSLAAENIDTRKYYDPPAHRQTAYKHFAQWAAPLDNTERLAATSLSLPLWSVMEDSVVLGVTRAIRRIHAAAEEVSRGMR